MDSPERFVGADVTSGLVLDAKQIHDNLGMVS
jgi:hypothetical protein